MQSSETNENWERDHFSQWGSNSYAVTSCNFTGDLFNYTGFPIIKGTIYYSNLTNYIYVS